MHVCMRVSLLACDAMIKVPVCMYASWTHVRLAVCGFKLHGWLGYEKAMCAGGMWACADRAAFNRLPRGHALPVHHNCSLDVPVHNIEMMKICQDPQERHDDLERQQQGGKVCHHLPQGLGALCSNPSYQLQPCHMDPCS